MRLYDQKTPVFPEINDTATEKYRAMINEIPLNEERD